MNSLENENTNYNNTNYNDETHKSQIFLKNFEPVAASQLKLYFKIASALQGLAMTALYAHLKTPIHVIARRSKATTMQSLAPPLICLKFVIWNLFGFWDLIFGICLNFRICN